MPGKYEKTGGHEARADRPGRVSRQSVTCQTGGLGDGAPGTERHETRVRSVLDAICEDVWLA